MLDCLTKVRAAGGWGILAHIDAGGGFGSRIEVLHPTNKTFFATLG